MFRYLAGALLILATPFSQVNAVSEDEAGAVTRIEDTKQLDLYIEHLSQSDDTGHQALKSALANFNRDKASGNPLKIGENRKSVIEALKSYNMIKPTADGHYYVPFSAPAVAKSAAVALDPSKAFAEGSRPPSTSPPSADVNLKKSPTAKTTPPSTPTAMLPGRRPPTAAPADSAPSSAKPTAPADQLNFSCIYAGSVIRGTLDKNGKPQKSCKPKSKFVDPRSKGDQKPVQRKDAKGKLIGKPIKLANLSCGTSNKTVNGKTVAVRTTNYVQCEPMKFGLHANGTPFCEPDGAAVSTKCKSDKKLEGPAAEQWAKAIREALPGPAAAYDQSVREICQSKAQGGEHWNNMFAKDDKQWRDIQSTCGALADNPAPAIPLPPTRPDFPTGTPAAPAPGVAIPESKTGPAVQEPVPPAILDSAPYGKPPSGEDATPTSI